jgi:hypothetical protein
VTCVHDYATAAIRFTTLDTTRAELRGLIDKEKTVVAVIEARFHTSNSVGNKCGQ